MFLWWLSANKDFILLLVLFFSFTIYHPGWPGNPYVDQAALEL